ncbi:hypothetical protein RF11_08845 [Thelohanellus kitauei]|uniref:Uncharacterized protein n=1 Tax=Thelohanellus kitauei TaxID=669202 RepID=A0A0C2M3Y4_THEKT|nr:hypothetical protein RF11_08845 [Thelohanellus kitauei]
MTFAVIRLIINSSEVILCGKMNPEKFEAFLKNCLQFLGLKKLRIYYGQHPFSSISAKYPEDYQFEMKYLTKYSSFLIACEEVSLQIKHGIRRTRQLQGAGDLLERMRV